MSAVDQLFQKLRSENRKALMPFITAGDPDLDFTAALIKELITRGCSLCELGIPYSDPIADGPVIQASYTRPQQENKARADPGNAVRTLTPSLSAADRNDGQLRHRPSPRTGTLRRRSQSGRRCGCDRSGSSGRRSRTARHDLPSRRFFADPTRHPATTPRERALRIAETSTGFLYYVSVTGITGERTQLPKDLADNVAWLRQRTTLPICIGFGVSQPDHVKLLAPVADGLIVGSAIVRRMSGRSQWSFPPRSDQRNSAI